MFKKLIPKANDNMANELFEKYKKTILSDNSFYTKIGVKEFERSCRILDEDPYFSDSEKKDLLKDWFEADKARDFAYYILISYTLTIHRDDVDLAFVSSALSLIEKDSEFDWSTITDEDVLALFNKKSQTSMVSSMSFHASYLEDMNIHSFDTDEYLEIDTPCPCIDSVIGISRNVPGILNYLYMIISGNKSRVIILDAEDRWKTIPNKYKAIRMFCVSDNVKDVLSDVESALKHLKPGGYVILERNILDENNGIWKELQSELIKANLLQAYVHDFNETLYLQSESDYKGVYVVSKRRDGEHFEHRFYRQFIDINIVEANDYDLSSFVRHPDLIMRKGDRAVRLKEILTPITKVEENHKVGRVFKYKNMSTGYNDWCCTPEDLDLENVNGTFVKATWPVCVLNQDLRKPRMTYICASEENPVFIGEQFLTFRMNESIIKPEYFFLLVFNGQFAQFVSKHLGEIESDMSGEYQISATEWDYFEDPGMAVKLSDSYVWFSVPVGFDAQDREIKETKLVWKVMADKENAYKVLFEELEWLNEQHIRNIKHKTRGDIDSIKGDLTTLKKAFKRNNNQLRLDDSFNIARDRSVEEAIDSMLRGLTKVVDTVSELTGIAMNQKEINLYDFFLKYADESHYANQCNICIFNMAKDLNIIVDPSNLQNVIDLFIENALRHGKKDDLDANLIIRISCEDCYDGTCMIALENNGKPMSPRAKEIYFVRDSYAGETANTGQGGAEIKRLVNSNHGRVELCAIDEDEYPVRLRMYFTISNK